MLKIDKLRCGCIETDLRKYKRLSRESHKFAKVYAKFIKETQTRESAEDFVLSLRTHLLMKNFKMKKINSYINEIVLPQMNNLIETNLKMFKKKQKKLEEIK